jgi:hypothetical protein
MVLIDAPPELADDESERSSVEFRDWMDSLLNRIAHSYLGLKDALERSPMEGDRRDALAPFVSDFYEFVRSVVDPYSAAQIAADLRAMAAKELEAASRTRGETAGL